MPDPATATYATTETLPWAIREWARKEPDRPFLLDIEGTVRSYGEIHVSALRWAGAFAAAGVSAGDNVPAMMRPTLAAREYWLGLAWLRAVQAGVNTDFVGNSLVYVLNNSQARHMICAPEFLPRLADVADRLEFLETVIVPGAAAGDLATDGPLRLVAADELYAAASPVADDDVPERHDIACISYTSGTTGPSKGVLVPWGRTYPNAAWDHIGPDDVFYCAFPVFHMSGLLPLAWTAFAGGRVLIRDGFKTQHFWDDVRRFGCTTTALIPAMMNWLVDQPERDDDIDNTLSYVNGAPVIPRADEFMRRFGVRMGTVFSNTEVGTCLVADGPVTADRASHGLSPAPGFEVRVVDEHDYEVPDGTLGELIVRTDHPWRMMAGYFGMPEKTAEAWRNGWFHTGDGLERDAAGKYRFVDRIKDSMRRRGENISSMEVETYVNEHPAVAETAAIGVPSEHGEDEVKVCVVLNEGQTVEHAELHAFLVARMPAFMVPRYIEYLDAPERTEAMHRIKKMALRADALNANTWDAKAGITGR